MTAVDPHKETRENNFQLRRGTPDDSYTVFTLFEHSLYDLINRMGAEGRSIDAQTLANTWSERLELYEHLAATADEFWIAEQAGRPVGYARSILREGHQELTEFFVLPEVQAAGLGKVLLERAFPEKGAGVRSIIATSDAGARALYLRAGVYTRTTVINFNVEPIDQPVETDLSFQPFEQGDDILETLACFDRKLLGHRRDSDHSYLRSDRQGYLYLREGRPVGYGYEGKFNGPFAMLNSSDYPAVLAHAESTAARKGRKFGLEVPGINQAAIQHLLGRGHHFQPFVVFLMSSRPFGRLENYLLTSPPFFL